MGVLQKALIESLDGLPHLLLKASLEKKLAEQGCKDEELADKIASAILAADHSNEDIDLDVPFDIEFSEADNDDLQRQVDEVVSNMPTFIEEASKDFARGLLDVLRVKWIKQSSERSSESDEMRQKIAHNWGDAFSDFKFLIEICSGYGDDFNHAYLKTRLKRDRLRNYTLSRLHIRACRIAGEIALLLDNGYTEGAQARWRTLLEVSVTALLISKGGDDLAQRYLDHEAIDKKRVLDDHDWAAKAGRLGG